MTSIIEEKMKLAPLVSTGAIGEMILYQDMIVLNKVSEDTIHKIVERLKEQFPSVKHFLYVDGIFFRPYQPEQTPEMKRLLHEAQNFKYDSQTAE